ncbi:MAG: hypothetical protein ACLVAH_11675 [Anaeromassilibacillus sp.]
MIRYYSGYMTQLSMWTRFGSLGMCRFHPDYNL